MIAHFNPQGPHGPRPRVTLQGRLSLYFNPQGPHGPRRGNCIYRNADKLFQSTRPSRASTMIQYFSICVVPFQSTRPSRASTQFLAVRGSSRNISIHKALTGLDDFPVLSAQEHLHFNPQGPHGPRQRQSAYPFSSPNISIHKALTGLDGSIRSSCLPKSISIHKALTGLDCNTM